MKSTKARPETELFHRNAVERVIAAMRRRLDTTPSLEELAEIALMSPFHFSRTFHQVTGLPPLRFLAALRMERAKELLLFTDASVFDICFEVGYSSLGSFCMRFRNVVGLSPSAFRALGEEDPAWRLDLSHDPSAQPVAGFDQGGGLWGWIDAPAACSGPIFVGLFPLSIPEGLPIACTHLERPGEFFLDLGQAPDGSYHVFAVALDWTVGPKRLLLYDGALRGALPPGESLTVQGGQAAAPVSLTLVPAAVTMPPILTAVPFVLMHSKREAAEKLTNAPWLLPRKWEYRESSPGR
jgi:AraC family transcriptional regulator